MAAVPSIHVSDADGNDDQLPPSSGALDVTYPRRRLSEPLIAHMIHKNKIHTIRIWKSRKLGSGGFGVVCKADMAAPDGSEEVVAVKIINPSLANDEVQASELLQREISGWEKLDHPRILPLYGTCDVDLCLVGLVSPLSSKGNMKHFIRCNPQTDRLRLIRQVAEGLEYLHCIAKIVHGDIKCSNVVISDTECALVADFGLSTWIERSGAMTATGIRAKNTAPFAAPELFTDEAFDEAAVEPTLDVNNTSPRRPRSKTTFTDVFAFGRLIYEAYAGSVAWESLPNLTAVFNACMNMTPPRPQDEHPSVHVDDRVWALCLDCWAKKPNKRPNCTQILKILNDVPQAETL